MPLSILGISWNVITVTSMMYIRVAAIDSVDGFTGVKVQPVMSLAHLPRQWQKSFKTACKSACFKKYFGF